jgi:hypothetical protein
MELKEIPAHRVLMVLMVCQETMAQIAPLKALKVIRETPVRKVTLVRLQTSLCTHLRYTVMMGILRL